MKRSLSFDDNPVKLKVSFDDDGKLSGDYDQVGSLSNHVGINCDRRLDRLQVLNGKKKMASSVLDILESNNRIEQMEIENYTLRKRCKRLENIVTQLLENKGKNEDDEEEEVGDDLNGRHGQIYENNIHLLKAKYKEPCYLEVPQSPPYENSKSPQYATRSPPGEGESSPPQFHHTTLPSMLVTAATSPSYSDATMLNQPPVSPPKTKENLSSDAASRVEGIAISDPRHAPQVHSPKEKGVEGKIKEEDESSENISPEEMEQRNEMFRATYYSQRANSTNSNSNSSNTTRPSIRRLSLNSEQHFPVDAKPKKHHSTSHYSECSTYERCHGYESSKTRSPELEVSPYYSRYHDYDVKADHERKTADGNQAPPPRLIGAPFPRERSKSYGESLDYHNKVTNSQVIYPPDKNLSEPMRSSKAFHSAHAQRHVEMKTFPLITSQRPLVSVMAADPDLNKYSSEFYRKLPPKLHIVESQNENGVTLTWNATSNCDSSLVKTYQLFARELFGHKVGTMKRIGTVDALPLPMSCNIDKLKYNIKYKFAVCAVDIYGRFGKMSNFTGKFELKPKGPVTVGEEKESEIEVII